MFHDSRLSAQAIRNHRRSKDMAIKDLRFDNLPPSTKLILFAILLVCMTAGFYMFYLKDQRDDLRIKQAKIEKLELSNQQGRAVESQVRQIELELASLKDKLERLESILPVEKETPTLLKNVQQMATSSNLLIDRFAPQPMIPRAFYSDWPIQLNVRGNYHGLGQFFEKISKSQRIIDVGSITITGIEKQKDSVETLTASCTATTYVFSDQSHAPQETTEEKK